MLYISWMDLLYKIRDYNQLSSLFIAREVVNIFPQYIAVQSRVSRFSWSLYSAQTLDQAICWRSKMCFQKFIIYILRYTHRKAPSWVFIRTWVLANHNSERNFCTSEKNNDTSNQIPRRRCVSLAPKSSPFYGACRLGSLCELPLRNSTRKFKLGD